MKYYISEAYYKIRSIFVRPNKDLREIANSLNTQGYHVIPRFIDNKECENLRSVYNALSEDKSTKVWSDHLGADKRIYGIDNISAEFKALFEKPLLQDLTKYYISSNTANMVLCNKITAVDNNLGSGGGWHRDSINRRQLKFIVYLTDSDAQTGCFEYSPGSQHISSKHNINKLLNRNASEYRYSDRDIEKLKEENIQFKNLEGKAGDLIIVDVSGIHRGRPIEKNERYACTHYIWEKRIPAHIAKLCN